MLPHRCLKARSQTIERHTVKHVCAYTYPLVQQEPGQSQGPNGPPIQIPDRKGLRRLQTNPKAPGPENQASMPESDERSDLRVEASGCTRIPDQEQAPKGPSRTPKGSQESPFEGSQNKREVASGATEATQSNNTD